MSDKNRTELLLVNPKSPTNVGAVLRASGCFKVDQVMMTGERFLKAQKFQTDTKNIQNQMPLIRVEKPTDQLLPGLKIVAVELVEGAGLLTEFDHPDQARYVFGPEDGTLTQSFINHCDHVVFIPTIGCLNLAATVNIVLYDRLLKLNKHPEQSKFDLDQFIRDNRDPNNRVRVKT